MLGFPESEQRITDLQVNVPLAATVALLAGRAYQRPTCPETVYERDKNGLPMVQGQVQESSLREWATSARHANLETARKKQVPAINAFVRVALEGSHVLRHRQFREFNPPDPPMHFLDAIRQALAASVAFGLLITWSGLILRHAPTYRFVVSSHWRGFSMCRKPRSPSRRHTASIV